MAEENKEHAQYTINGAFTVKGPDQKVIYDIGPAFAALLETFEKEGMYISHMRYDYNNVRNR